MYYFTEIVNIQSFLNVIKIVFIMQYNVMNEMELNKIDYKKVTVFVF